MISIILNFFFANSLYRNGIDNAQSNYTMIIFMVTQVPRMELGHHALGHLDYFQLRAIKNSDEYSVESTLQIGVPG